MRNNTGDTEAAFFFITDEDKAWNDAKVILYPVQAYSDFVEYTIPLASHPNWQGVIEQVRVDAVQKATSGTIEIDYIKIVTEDIQLNSTSITKGDSVMYGAEANPTGSPIGGGTGYAQTYTKGDFNVFNVSTVDELLSALSAAKPGDVVYINSDASLDLTGKVNLPIGVTLHGTWPPKGGFIAYRVAG
jgi:hypothetical protein